MVTKAKLRAVGMICVDCGTPVVDRRSNQNKGSWLSGITVVLALLVLSGLPAMLGSRVSSEGGSKPLTERSGTE